LHDDPERFAMELPQLNISDYASFLHYLTHLRTEGYQYNRFVVMVLHLPRKVAITFLREATFAAEDCIKCEAIDLLSRLSPSDAFPRCCELLHEADADVRIVALQCLQFMEVPCEEYIARLLRTETNGNVRCAAVDLLASVGTRRSIPVLTDLASHDTSFDYEGRPIRFFVEKALDSIQSPGGS
jgi:hypothetical protein